MAVDMERWQGRLDELAREKGLPGASLAILAEGEVHTAVTGVVNVETKVEVTAETLFAIGSTTKLLTATAIARLVEAGRLTLDTPVVDVLPEFRMRDAASTPQVTVRHLLTHTSGIAGDALLDTGPGDDALARYLERIAELPPDVPVGSVYSYSNAGFAVLGRIMEQLTGATWDAALRELVLDPLGLHHTTSVATDLVRFRATCGHVGPVGALELEPQAPIGSSARAMSPAGSTMYASARDVVTFGRLFLDGGVAHDGARVLSAESVAQMVRPQVQIPSVRPGTETNGLGWYMFEWDGRRVLEHGGGTMGHKAFFELVPDCGVAIALLTNGRNEMADELFRELFAELCELERPRTPEPAQAPDPDVERWAGRYLRCGVQVDVELRDGALVAVETIVEPLASMFPGIEPTTLELTPSSTGGGAYLCREDPADDWEPLVFVELDGQRFLHRGGRAHHRAG